MIEAQDFNVILTRRRRLGRTVCVVSGRTLIIACDPKESRHKALKQSIGRMREDLASATDLPNQAFNPEFPWRITW